MLIADARIWQGPRADVRILGDRIAAIGTLVPVPGERVIDAGGAALLPGLHDHHVHLAATAAAMASLPCGPPDVTTVDALAALVGAPGETWLRGIGYHESVAGMLTRAQLDEWAPHRPLRIQHRSGRMWFLNSAAIERLLDGREPPPGLERANGEWTGQLFDEDAWLRRALAGTPPRLAASSRMLARYGVTGVTDMSPSNDAASLLWLAEEQAAGRLVQRVVVAGSASLSAAAWPDGLAPGPLKVHLHENALPDLDATIAAVAEAHRQGRPMASHCTTEVELAFTLGVLAGADPLVGDRIEHAGMASDAAISEIARLGVQVVSQPHFILERGDQYLRDVPKPSWPLLYRLRAFADAGIPLAAGSDAPYGSLDPWAAMRAATNRTTREGRQVGADEALSPESAAALFLADPLDLKRERRVAIGEPGDLCLLDASWEAVRGDLDARHVRATVARGELVHDRIDKTPGERRPRVDTPA